jgi:hypothetical protein
MGMKGIIVAENTERPILFSAPMVRALLAGTKTQTRRAWPVQPPQGVRIGWTPETRAGRYGKIGDQLWVRENGWQRPERTPKMMREGADTWAPYYFDADGLSEQESADFKAWGFKRRPSIHMPRAHSRILLEVTEVRVQRLQDISEADCVAEGIRISSKERRSDTCYGIYECPMPDGKHHFNDSAYALYRLLWAQINGTASWNANPWVWAVSFRRTP